MLGRVGKRMREAVVWGLSAGLPLHALITCFQRGTLPTSASAGLRVLTLPAGLGQQTDLLEGWEAVGAAEGAETLAPVVSTGTQDGNLIARDESEPARAFPVQLYGQLLEGDLRMYCFLDTRNRRWFRLSPGEHDGPAGIRLQLDADGQARVVELSSGKAYRLVEGRRVLDPDPVADPGGKVD